MTYDANSRFRVLSEKHIGKTIRPCPNLIMINDPGKDLDDEQSFVLAAGLHRAGLIHLVAVVANLDPAIERARLTKGTFNELGLPDIPVGRGSNCFKGGQNLAHETDAPYANTTDWWDSGHELLCNYLHKLLNINLVLNSGLTDAAHLFMDDPDLFIDRVRSVTIMGGVLADGENVAVRTGPNGTKYMIPDDAANNAFDWPSALFLYQALQEHHIPMTIVMRHSAYAAQFPFSLYDRFAETGNPIGTFLLERQKSSINRLWKETNAPVGSPVRGKLPVSRDREWFVKVFCNGKDPGIEGDGEVWPYVGKYNQYDPMAVMASVPVLRDRFFEPIEVEVDGTIHQVIGLTPKNNGIRDGDGLRNMMSEMEIAALNK